MANKQHYIEAQLWALETAKPFYPAHLTISKLLEDFEEIVKNDVNQFTLLNWTTLYSKWSDALAWLSASAAGKEIAIRKTAECLYSMLDFWAALDQHDDGDELYLDDCDCKAGFKDDLVSFSNNVLEMHSSDPIAVLLSQGYSYIDAVSLASTLK